MLALLRQDLVLGRSRSKHEKKWQAETMSFNFICDIVVSLSGGDTLKQVNISAKFPMLVIALPGVFPMRVPIRQHREATDRAFDATDASKFHQLQIIFEIF